MNNITAFYCSKCENRWEGLYLPHSCPKCESIIGIAIAIEEDEDGNDTNRKTQS